MDSYPDPRYTAAYGSTYNQDGVWEDSVHMQRTTSQSTSRTVDSTYTASTSASGYSSATDYSTIDPALVRDAMQWEPSSHSLACYLDEPQENNSHILSGIGAQCYPSGQESIHYALSVGVQHQQGSYDACNLLYDLGSPYPDSSHDPTHALQPTSAQQPQGSVPAILRVAEQATRAARSAITQPLPFRKGSPSVITSNAVERAIRRREAEGEEDTVRPAVQDVLREHLLRQPGEDCFDAGTIGILEEAAYQLQKRLRGPEVVGICNLAIVTVLGELYTESGVRRRDADPGRLALQSSGPQSSRSRPTEKDRFVCELCGKKSGRQADLERHTRNVHLDEDEKTKFPCDYRRCGRHKLPFFRQDHLRDHLRTFHHEDILRRGVKLGEDEGWWSSRAPYALREGWWRCSRCLARVSQAQSGFVCPGCGIPCEAERQKHRLGREA